MDVICIGEIIVDFIPINDFTYKACFGGAPMNCAIACAHLGLKVGAITAVGNDAFGRFLINTLASHKVDITHVKKIPNTRTTLAFVVKLPGGEREFFFYRKPWSLSADTELKFTDSDIDYLRLAKVVHISGFALSQEPSRSEILKILPKLKSHNILISLDPTFRIDVWDSEEKARETYATVLKYVDILLATLKEHSLLFETNDVGECIRLASKHGIRIIGVKMGEKGAILSDGNNIFFMKAYKVPVKDTVGAGDAWNAGILYGIVKGLPLDHSLRIANAIAAIKCMHVGAIVGLPTIEEVRKFINLHKENAPKRVIL
ncbi:MAG: sugar kinase [Thermoprotei archaeon]|nr:sugar kinase [Thermoprotei archaeon]